MRERRSAWLPGRRMVVEPITKAEFRSFVVAGVRCFPPPRLVGRVVEVDASETVMIEFSPEDAQLIQDYE